MPGLDEGGIFFTQTLSLSLLSIAVHGKLLLTCGSRSHLQANSSNPMLKQILAEKVWKFSMLPQKANYYQAPQKR